MKVLSLFDGMGCGWLAFKDADITVDEYYAYEIDKNAIKVATYNIPEIKECGDVFDEDFTKYNGQIDYLIGGSPCTYWSIAQSPDAREKVASGKGWELFSQYVRALNEVKPKYFIYENNKSMDKLIKESINEIFGFEPIMIDSSLFSAQKRLRYYWVGKREEDGTYSKVDISLPQNNNESICDILNIPADSRELKSSPQLVWIYPYKNGVQDYRQATRVYSIYGKGVSLKALGGGLGARSGLYIIPVSESYDGEKYLVKDNNINFRGRVYPIEIEDGYYIIRGLDINECKMLQNIPKSYDMSCISVTQAHKCLGNGWTVKAISHIIQSIQK